MRSAAGHIILYHGTTKDRAGAIINEGFKRQGKHSRKIWFTRKSGDARRIARVRAEQRSKEAVVLRCEIDLKKYSNFLRHGADHYAFRYSHLDKDVIHSVTKAKDGPTNLVRRFLKETNVTLPQPFGNFVNLWYGTTENRARAIMNKGFKEKRRGRGILFTRKSREAHSMAKVESKRCGEGLVVFHCDIDLEEYPAFDRPKPTHYVFRHSYISKDVILSISGLEKDKVDDHTSFAVSTSSIRSGEALSRQLVDVVITRNAGRLGVLYWINRYLELKGGESIKEDHPAVEAIFKWVEGEYAAGREGPISNEEILAQVMTHLKEEVQIGETTQKSSKSKA